MGKLVYGAIASVDGYIEDAQGSFDWAEPQEDLHSYINRLEEQNEVLIYGRRMYETMAFWESPDSLKDFPPYAQEYGRIWRGAEKIVYSTTLAAPLSAKTLVRAVFDPNDVRLLKESRTGAIGIGGAGMAGTALSHGLVDEVYLFLQPVVIGNGKPAIPGEHRMRLSLVETQRFDGGVVMLHYLVVG